MFNHVSWNAWKPTSYGIDTNPQNNASNGKPCKSLPKPKNPKTPKTKKRNGIQKAT
jgi:hypothetical protein